MDGLNGLNRGLLDLIEQGRVKCLCGRTATGTTPDGEPECDDLSCQAAEEIDRMRRELRAAIDALYTAHDFTFRVTNWKGNTPEERDELLVEIEKHLPLATRGQ